MSGDDTSNTASTVLGTIGTVLWCIQLIPQIYRNFRVKDCEGMPPIMMFLWAASGVPFGVYFVVQNSTKVIQVQPHMFMFFALIVWMQTLYYPPVKWPLKKVAILVTTVCCLFGGIEAGLIVPLRIVYRNGVSWPTTLVGAIAAVLLAAGLVPPYIEIYKHNGEVVGINFVFLGLDFSGAMFSIFAVIAQRGDLDIMGIVLYCIVASLELGIFTCQIIWLLRTRKQRKQRKLDEAESDDKGENEAADLEVGTVENTTAVKPISEEKTYAVVADEEKAIHTSSSPVNTTSAS